ncbi:AAA family ATPase [Leptothoe kymatousa]|uniref:histidine kinase n=1 Tax=Leptothoe kymatousa TAU-MAC 1615 TaxID=2364775 RepID=A0ABS5Y4T7_9CYAN|nr:AAA family ATPase [Leptothoe kymatousa]MBT9312848.1 AAA family ATPase [Leptothoe kymatousa TAU-MAC 1615]
MTHVAEPLYSALSLSGYTLAECIYQGTQTVVYRAMETATQRPVVVKLLVQEYPSFADLVQFRNQYTVARNLPIAGIVHPLSLETWGNSYALVMEDCGEIDLEQYAQQYPMALADSLDIAVQLATIVHHLHQHQVMHKDIKPTNILIHPVSKQIKLIDFSLASLLPRETQTIQSPQRLEGTLAYMAPEQTGRMNRGIDYRTDFYALGVTLYQLLTGRLPFISQDPLELIHCHLAQMPMAVDQVNPSIPTTVATIVATLMAKNAENRYQSALGLKYDLEECLSQWRGQGKIAEFALRQRDLVNRFLLPEKLYGRETEIQALLNAFNRVTLSTSELMLVAGFSGIGKTAVVNEVHKPITRQRGYFIKGKFDQFNRNIPLSAFLQALQDLMGQLISESDAQLATWKAHILDAVGKNGQVLIDVIPGLQQIIGHQPPVIALSGEAAQTRFNQLFQSFIEVFSTVKHPLVIFLDDLQWADTTSLQLIKLLVTNNRYCLLIGAYRDNEVSSVHPLMLAVDELKQSRAIVNTIPLKPLAFDDTNHLIADTLQCSTDLARPLTTLVDGKTRGNPFFTTRFLKALYEDGLLSFDQAESHWKCDLSQVKAMALTDDVVEFMVAQLQKLPLETQQILKLAACVGNQFDLNTLAVVVEKTVDDVAQALWQALKEGVVLPTSQVYKFFQFETNHRKREINPTYQFLHDRVQQAAYCLIQADKKQTTHLKIGKLLLDATDVADNLFSIVNHWNMGAALVTDVSDRAQLCQLNLKAADKAKRATAYDAAYRYAVVGIQSLGAESWQTNYELTLALHDLATESAYLKGDFANSQRWAHIVLKHAKNILDKVQVQEINLLAYTAQKRTSDAIEIGLKSLERLNISIPSTPTQGDIQTAWAEVGALIAQTKIESLCELPQMADNSSLAALRILNSMAATVYLTQPQLFPLIVLAQVKLSLLNGNTPVSAGAYARYSFMLCSKIKDIELGYTFGRLALSLAQKFNDKAINTRVLLMVGALTLPWKVHLRESIPLLKTAYLSGLESGNLDGAALSRYYESQSSYIIGGRLQELAKKVATHSQQIRGIKQQLHLYNNDLLHQVILNLLGTSKEPYRIVGEVFDETKMLAQYHASSNVLGLFCLYLHKAMLCYWFGEWATSIEYTTEAANYLAGSTAQATIPLFYVYDSLARLTQYPEVAKVQQDSILVQVNENQEKIGHWAKHAPMNFQHKYDLVLAEQHHYLGERAIAIDLYERAIAGAKTHGYIQEEALGNELAARFYLNWGKENVAAIYMQEAYYGYSRWGAKAKVADLERRYPELLRPILKQTTRPMNIFESKDLVHSTLRLKTDVNSFNQIFDFASILQASQALSCDMPLHELLNQLIQIILQNSGGDLCVLLLPNQSGELQVRATATLEAVQLTTEPVNNNPNLPIKLIQYVKNGREAIVIDDLETDLPVIDPYLKQRQPKSLLCLPIFNQGNLIGVVYLENSFVSCVFTEERIVILNFLCTQAAISLENAQLYQQARVREQAMQRQSIALVQLSKSVSVSQGRLTDAYREITETVAQLLDVERVSIWLLDPENSKIRCVSLFEAAQRQHSSTNTELLRVDYPAYFSAILAEPILSVEDAWHDPRTYEFKHGYLGVFNIVSMLDAGFNLDGEISGIICCETIGKKRVWNQSEQAFIQSVANLIALAVEANYKQENAKQLKLALADLEQSQLQLVQSEKMSALGNLVSGIAHEINNPIGCILGNVDTTEEYFSDLLGLLDRYAQQFPDPGPEIANELTALDLDYIREDLPKLMRAMQDSSDRITDISSSLRIFSRADTETRQVFDLHKGLDSTILILRHRLKVNKYRPDIAIIKEYGDIPDVNCFPGQLNQVFMNILANAIDALDEASQRLSAAELAAHAPHISIRTEVDSPQHVKVFIADNGPGIPENIKGNIFDTLFTTKSVGKGTGLGLAISHQIVTETHLGSLTVESEMGKGTQFCIRLPILAD